MTDVRVASVFDDPLAEPTEHVRWGFIAVLALANLGIWTAFFTPIQFLLPLQVEGIVGADTKETSLSLVLTVGAFASMVVNPLAGAFSDRTTSRLGRRRPWVLWPTVAAVAVLYAAVRRVSGRHAALMAGSVLAQTQGQSGCPVVDGVPDLTDPQDLKAMVTAINELRKGFMANGQDGSTAALHGLEAELDRADVLEPKDMPANVVTMNSTVRFTLKESGKTSTLQLVYPRDMDGSSEKVSIFAPVGIALLGLRVGDELQMPSPTGQVTVHVEAITWQPESAGELHR